MNINPGAFYNWVKRLRKNGCRDIPEKNQLSTYEQSHQEVVKIEMNSISVPTDMNKNTDTAAMESIQWEISAGNRTGAVEQIDANVKAMVRD